MAPILGSEGIPGDLAELSGSFLAGISSYPIMRARMTLLQCCYDVDRFEDAHYKTLGVRFPEQFKYAVKSRRAEYLAGRVLAHVGLSSLGIKNVHIPSGRNREPIWPKSAIGSITHSYGRCATILSNNSRDRVGVDIERIVDGETLAAVQEVCLSCKERKLLNTQTGYSRLELATLMFSAKETLFKMLYPSVRCHFGYETAMVREIPTSDTISLYLTENLRGGFRSGSTFEIRFSFHCNFVLTWATLGEPNPQPRSIG